MIRVLIVEDDPMAQKLLENFIENSGRYKVIGSIASAGFAETYCLKHSVDLILMDVCTALGVSGLEISAKIKKIKPDIKIIIITSQPECDFINRAKTGGVDSFWYKSSDEKEILELMDRTMAGESIYPDCTPSLQIGYAWNTEFTPRQLEVLRELTSGDTNGEIGERLGISANTVRDYIQQMLEMTGLQNRTSLAVAADKSGLVNKNY
ncbi:MAG: response regulator transcription factor [Tissierellia bacterium]|nr:response regulator transcription factor [Tissierellia bacterium]